MIAGITSKPTSTLVGFLLCGVYGLGFVQKNNSVKNSTGSEADRSGLPRILGAYVALVLLINFVNDGWSGRPTPLAHQLLLLPFTAAFAFVLVVLLSEKRPERATEGARVDRRPLESWLLWVVGFFELIAIVGFLYEQRHFARFGYLWCPVATALIGVASVLGFAMVVRRRSAVVLLGWTIVVSASGIALAVSSFPLNYLRSDMLPVTLWADQRLVRHLNPYATMHMGSRIYDFPYLPGVLVAYLPAVAAHVDPRWVNLLCIEAAAILIYFTAGKERRMWAALLVAVFVLSPFLQYRHELYLAPHWLALVAAGVLMQRRHFVLAAFAFGAGMAVYQLLWVIFPFLLLYAFWRGGGVEAFKIAFCSAIGALAIVGPFLSSAVHRIASNTVGQWSKLPHAVADPMNLSYWLTFVVRPAQLRWVQLGTMIAIFACCVLRKRCATLTDTLRWSSGALAIFIALNVLVDGYFYLTLLLLVLMYTCCVSGIWEEPTADLHENVPHVRGARAVL